jgi:hypothetical protein
MSNAAHRQRPTARHTTPTGILGVWARFRRWLGIG